MHFNEAIIVDNSQAPSEVKDYELVADEAEDGLIADDDVVANEA